MNTLRVQNSAVSQERNKLPTRRILFVARWPVGGIRTHLRYNAPALTDAGYRCTFVVPDDDSLSTFRATFGSLPEVDIVPVPVKKKRCSLWPATRQLLRTGEFALVHSHGLTAAVHTVAANFGIGVPHITTVHDALRRDQFAGLKGQLKRWLMGQILSRLDGAVCVTNDIRENLLDYFPALRRSRTTLEVISNGIDSERYRHPTYTTHELRERLHLKDEVVLIGFLGRFMEQKGFLPLLAALEQLKREGAPRTFHLVAVGSGDRRREYTQQIVQRGLSDNITILDFVADIKPLLVQLDLLVVPSLWEASSLVSMEAMAAGIPVLGTNCIGLREVLSNTPSRTVPFGDASALCRGLREALTEPWTMDAREFASEACDRFDNNRSARHLIAMYARFARPLSRRIGV